MPTLNFPTGSGVTMTTDWSECKVTRNPADDSYFVQFTSRDYVVISGTNSGSTLGGAGNLVGAQADVDGHCYAISSNDPVTGQDLSNVSVAGVKLILKKMFADLLYAAQNP